MGLIMEELIILDLLTNKGVREAFEAEELSDRQAVKYKIPVPENLQYSHIPDNINDFITRIYPNMRQLVLARMKSREIDVDEIINYFVAYMLGNNRWGTPRYKMYDVLKYPNNPFYKWFIKNLHFFCFYNRKLHSINEFTSSLIETSDDSVPSQEFHTVSLDHIDREGMYESPESVLFTKELPAYLQEFSKQAEYLDSFQANAYRLFVSRVQGESNNDFANSLGISASAASQWFEKLKILINAYLDGNPVGIHS